MESLDRNFMNKPILQLLQIDANSEHCVVSTQCSLIHTLTTFERKKGHD